MFKYIHHVEVLNYTLTCIDNLNWQIQLTKTVLDKT